MKRIYILALIGIFGLSFSPQKAQAQKDVFWTHGLGGNSDSWKVYRDHYLSQYNTNGNIKVNAPVLQYQSDIGLSAAALDVHSKLNNRNAASDAIGIGHSMGGVVLREMDRKVNNNQLSQRFGGLITSGSPNKGSQLAYYFSTGDVENFFMQGCKEAGADVNSALRRYPFAHLILNASNIPLNIFCQDIWDAALLDWTEFASPASLNDLMIQSQAINELNTNSTSIPQICLWGDEQSPVHWRYLSSLTLQPSSQNSISATKSDDSRLANIVYTYTDILSKVVHGRGAAIIVAGGLLNFFTPKGYEGLMFEAKEAKWWLRNSEQFWNVLIGGGHRIESTSEVTELTIEAQIRLNAIYAQYNVDELMSPRFIEEMMKKVNAILNNPNNYRTYTKRILVISSSKSDGLIAEYSAKIDGVLDLKVNEANHQQMVNHPNLKFQMDNVFTNINKQAHPIFKL